MSDSFSMQISAWSDGAAIPAKYAFGQPGSDAPFATSDNISPAIAWSGAPAGTQSFVVICRDVDVPSSGEDVNQAGKTVPADLSRVDFFHWLLVDIAADVSGLPEGIGGRGITPRGKSTGDTEFGVTGQNDYTDWFAGDDDMQGVYGGYDGPCPPWNDSIIHHYYFEVYALDVASLELQGNFTGQDVLAAMQGHVLATAKHMGTYSMNPAVRT